MRGLVIGLIGMAGAAFAQEAPLPNIAVQGAGQPGGVAQVALAHRLYQQGIERRDAVDVMAAARLVREVRFSTLSAQKSTEPVPGVEPGEPMPGAPGPVTVPGMLAAARALSGEDEILLTLLDRVEAEAPDGRITAARAESALPSGQRDVWSLTFFGGALAEIAVIGDGDGNLDLTVTDESGTPVCLALGPVDIAYCDWVPARNGAFTVTVTNPSRAENSYLLLRN
jgi:hypothetical protein